MAVRADHDPAPLTTGPGRITVCGYLRPRTLEEALECLARDGARLLGGGTKATSTWGQGPVEVVDLQALGLGGIAIGPGMRIVVGASTTLQEICEHGGVPGALREAARREAPSTLRSLSTLGGCVAAAEAESELLATLIVHEAQLELVGAEGRSDVGLEAVLAEPSLLAGRIVTAVAVECSGATSAARAARTEADRPIVAAVARRTAEGVLLLALSGVAATPLRVDAERLGLGALDALEPPGDRRGSTDYRRHLAGVLARRALAALGGGAGSRPAEPESEVAG